MPRNKSILSNRRAVSPVIATVILVAVAITVAVAVAFWMSGIASQYTKFEKVEIQSAWSEKNVACDCWEITLELKNTGSAASTTIRCFINDIPVNETGYNPSFDPSTDLNSSVRVGVSFDEDAGLTLDSGEENTIKIYISYDPACKFETLSSGTSITVRLHSSGGMDYVKIVELI